MPIIDIEAPLTLSDLFAALPGVFLLGGFLLALYFAARYAPTTVTVRQQTANYRTEKIKVWQPHAATEQPREFYFYEVKFPITDEGGKPVLSVEDQTFSGRGNPKVLEERTPIVIPTIADPPLKISKSEVFIPPAQGPDGFPATSGTFYTQLSYEPVVTYRETDVDEVRKSVVFDVGINSERYAVLGGVVGSIVSVLYFFIKAFVSSRTAGVNQHSGNG